MLARASGRQLQLPFDPMERLEFRRLPRSIPAFWALCIKEGGRFRQECYPLEKMEFVLKNLRRDIDAGMSQALFENRTRRMVHVKLITCSYLDADVSNSEMFRGLKTDAAVGLILALLDDRGIPRPSVIIFSGRGYHLKWYWSSPLPRAAAGKAVAVNRALIQALPELRGDYMAVPVSTVLRVVGTTNPKSGLMAEVVWIQSDNGRVVVYPFNGFADEVLPKTRAEVRAERKATEVSRIGPETGRKTNPGWKSFCPEHWASGTLSDYIDLIRMRHGMNAPVGCRDKFGFLSACSLAVILRGHADLWHEIAAFCRGILPHEFVDGEFSGFCSSLLERARLDTAGQTTMWHGREVTNVYTYSKERIIEILGITTEEMRGLQCLIDTDEKNRRKRAVHQAKDDTTGLDREGYLALGIGRPAEPPDPDRLALAVRAKALFDAGATWTEVAKALEIKSAQAARKLSERAISQGLVSLR